MVFTCLQQTLPGVVVVRYDIEIPLFWERLKQIELGGRGRISQSALFIKTVRAIVDAYPLTLPVQCTHPSPKMHPAEWNKKQ